MAEGGDDMQALHKFQELFSGRFSTEDAATILLIKEGNLVEAVNWVLTCEPDEIRQALEEEHRNAWIQVQRVRGGRRPILERAASGRIDTEARLFACRPCDNFWWRRAPTRKEVSKCGRCHVRYDPVPREREWGWAEFSCSTCGRVFRGWCAVDQFSPCHGCRNLIRPERILPPTRRNNDGRRSRYSHRCQGCTGPNMTCVHPQMRISHGLPRVVYPSDPHDSSGSTVDTFLPQDDLLSPEEVFFPGLPAIRESDEDNEDDDDGSVGGNAGSDDEG